MLLLILLLCNSFNLFFPHVPVYVSISPTLCLVLFHPSFCLCLFQYLSPIIYLSFFLSLSLFLLTLKLPFSHSSPSSSSTFLCPLSLSLSSTFFLSLSLSSCRFLTHQLVMPVYGSFPLSLSASLSVPSPLHLPTLSS